MLCVLCFLFSVFNCNQFCDCVNYICTYRSERALNAELGTNLVSIHSSDEDDLLKQYVKSSANVDNIKRFWIGFNDIENEKNYVWTDGTKNIYDGFIYDDWKENIYVCDHVIYEYFGYCPFWYEDDYYHGDPHDGVCLESNGSRHGWNDINENTILTYIGVNPDIMYAKYHSQTSFMESIESIDCVEANRGYFVTCMDFEFGQDLTFGDELYSPLETFICDGANQVTGYNNGAWLLNGLLFGDNNGTLDSLIGVSCCLLPGTVYKDSQQVYPENEHISPYETITVEAKNSQSEIGIRSIERGAVQSVRGFNYDCIEDYQPIGCNTQVVPDCSQNNIGQIVDYEGVTATDGRQLKPEIEVNTFECGDGCNPNITSQCSNAYYYDTLNNNGQANPFNEKFECSNINYTLAVMDNYKQCNVYPVFAAMFYDYDSELHREMLVEQLTPYSEALAQCVIKLLQTFFVWLILMFVVFPLYFRIEEEVASRCCDAIRLNRVVQVAVAERLVNDEELMQSEHMR